MYQAKLQEYAAELALDKETQEKKLDDKVADIQTQIKSGRKDLAALKNELCNAQDLQARSSIQSVFSVTNTSTNYSEATFESKFESLAYQKAKLQAQLYALKSENETHEYLFNNPPCESQTDKTLFTECVEEQ